MRSSTAPQLDTPLLPFIMECQRPPKQWHFVVGLRAFFKARASTLKSQLPACLRHDWRAGLQRAPSAVACQQDD